MNFILQVIQYIINRHEYTQLIVKKAWNSKLNIHSYSTAMLLLVVLRNQLDIIILDSIIPVLWICFNNVKD